MLGSDLYAYILRTLIRTDKSTEAYDAMTDTIKDIKRQCKLEEEKKVSAALSISTLGEYTISLPSDFGEIIGDNVRMVDGSDSYNLARISKTELDRLESNPDYASVTKSKPSYFCIFNDKLYLYPVPDSISYSYYLNYAIGTETDVTSATTDVTFSADNRELLKYGVLYRIYRDLENNEEAAKWKVLYDNEMIIMQNRDNRNSQPATIVKSNEDW